MKHELLGEIAQVDVDPFDGVARVRHGSRHIRVNICCEDEAFENVLNLAAEVVRRLPELDMLAKQVAVINLREAYNKGWNAYDEAQEDGTFKMVSNPELSEAQFEAKLSLDAINITGNGTIDFFYDNDRMFWGHSVVVSSLNGTDLSNARADIFG